ncbi:MAG: metallophosphoesterase [Pseudomonadota bacterium]
MTRLFHVSDVHFGREDKAAVIWFGELVSAEQPDAIVMTGDLTMRARSHEFAAALAWLQSLGRPVTVEVGNHDLPYFNPFDRIFRPYRRYHGVEALVEKPLDLPGVAIVPLVTTARAQWRLNWANGHVSTRELQKTLALVEAAPKDSTVLIACHHPLVGRETGMASHTRRGDAAFEALAQAGVTAVLSGHVHDAFDIERRVGDASIRMIGAGTLSERTRSTLPSFNEIRIENGRFDVLSREMGADAA